MAEEKLSDEQLTELLSRGMSTAEICREHDINRRTIERKRKRLSIGDSVATASSAEITHQRALKKAKRYVVTSAQNATLVHKGFFDSLKKYCQHNKAQLIIIPSRYRNPTRPTESTDDNWWHQSVMPYLYGDRCELVPGLLLMGDIKIQPTAVNPLSGLHTITGSKCALFGHTKAMMESVPTRGTELPKLLYTTGTVTRANYSDSKAGKKGEFHHVLGAVVVEQSGEDFHIRTLNANSRGHFTDLGKRYSSDGVEDAAPPAAFVMGDLHAIRADEPNLNACHSIIDTLKPRRVVLHDVLDFQSKSHHNNWFERFALYRSGRSDVAEELTKTIEVIDRIAAKAQTNIISSNHDEHLFKWLESQHNATDLQNALVYHRLKYQMLESIVNTGKIPNPLKLASQGRMANKVNFVGRDGLSIHGIELGYHGDKGPNGARGNANAFDRIGVKTIIGHSHTPRVVGGCYQTGTSSLLDMGYNLGPSSWLHSHVIVYADGKRSHIHVINGKWRA